MTVIIFIFLACNKGVDPDDPGDGFGTISGTVYTAEDSTALKGTDVRLVGTNRSVMTNSAGSFIFSNLPSDEVILQFKKEHYIQHLETFDLINGQDLVMESPVYLYRGYCIITGMVIDINSGNPVSNAEVTIAKVVDSLVVDSATTDSAGHFFVNYIEPDTSGYLILMEKPGFQTSVSCTTGQAGDSIFVTGYLERYHIAKGSVYESDSITPVRGAAVSLGDKIAISDDFGEFIIPDLPPNDTQYLAAFSKSGYYTQTCSVSVGTPDTVFLTGYLQRKLTITGFVYESDSTTPVKDVSVSFIDTTLQSDTLGRFEYRYLAPVDSGYLFTFSKANYEIVTIRDTIKNDDTKIGPVYMDRFRGSLKGVVRLQGQIDHSGSVVTLGSEGLSDTADSEGRIEISGIPVGTYLAAISGENYKTATDSMTISKNDTARLDTTLIIQAGTIHTKVEWTDTLSPYIITDALHVMESGSLFVNAGVTVSLAKRGKLSVSGLFRSHGSPGRFVVISPLSPGGADGNIIEVNGNTVSDTTMKYTQILNLKTVLKGAPRISNCIFACLTPDTSSIMHILSSADTTCLNHCDFVRYNTRCGPILLQDSAGSAGTVFTNTIFSQFGDSPECTNFMKSQNKINGIIVQIRNSDFYSEHTLPYDLLELINPDSSQVYTVNPEYENPEKMDLRLKSVSTLLDKSTAGGRLGAIGETDWAIELFQRIGYEIWAR